MNDETIEISILISTYNHVRYVRRCLDSVIEQKINVPYEIIIIDDASTDGTKDLLKEYTVKFTDIIRLYVNERNSYPYLSKKSAFFMKKARGKFRTWIEGDDFWIDDQKIQKQYDFLLAHPEYSACSTESIVVDAEGRTIEGYYFYDQIEGGIYTLDDFRKLRRPGLTASIFFRNYEKEEIYPVWYEASRTMGDITSIMIAVMHGPIYQMPDVSSAYRYVANADAGNFNSIHRDNKYYELMILQYWIRLENFGREEIDPDFELIPIESKILYLSGVYEADVLLPVVKESSNKRYVELADKCINCRIDRIFHENTELKNHRIWGDFWEKSGEYIIFGAGNLAVWYMDHFGWDERILFLVDNDGKKWDKPFKGSLIKRPEFISEHSEAAVLIINELHEREIEQQLLDIGVNDYYCLCDMLGSRKEMREVRNLMRY